MDVFGLCLGDLPSRMARSLGVRMVHAQNGCSSTQAQHTSKIDPTASFEVQAPRLASYDASKFNDMEA